MNERQKLLTLLDDTILVLPRLASDPYEWQDWVLYLLEGLDWQAQADENREPFNAMLRRLRDEIQTRLERENWWIQSIEGGAED